MNDKTVIQILEQIAGGNSVFDTNPTEVSNLLGYGPEVERSEEEAANLRHHLDTLAQRGCIKIVNISTADAYTADLTSQGRDLLRRLRG